MMVKIPRGIPRPVFTDNALRLPFVQIQNGNFYKHNKLDNGAPTNIFPHLSFHVPPAGKEIWAVVGPSSCGKTTLLEVLQGLHHCDPPQARSYPALESREAGRTVPGDPSSYIKYVGFGSSNPRPAQIKGAYLSARFESRREATDFSLAEFLTGNVNLNPDEYERAAAVVARNEYFFQFVAERLNLHALLDLPVSNLSNGQTRRATIAKALMTKPHVLLLDEPFNGLDPLTKKSFSLVLHRLIRENHLPMVFALHSQEEIPSFVSHILYLNSDRQVESSGMKGLIVPKGSLKLAAVTPWKHYEHDQQGQQDHSVSSSADVITPVEDIEPSKLPRETAEPSALTAEPVGGRGLDEKQPKRGDEPPIWWNMAEKAGKPPAETTTELVVQMSGIKIAYGDRTVVGDWAQEHEGTQKPGLWWTIRPGDRWGVFGPNGSGKTTLLSLICSDHPQSYSQPIKLFGRSRLPSTSEPGISIFDLQARIGQSSPEILSFFPKQLTVRQVLESAWADTFLAKPRLWHEADQAVDACLRFFKPDLHPQEGDKDGHERLCFPAGRTRDEELSRALKHQVEVYLEQDLDWAESLRFGELTLQAQKVALFVRAVIKKPDLVILDEAFSGMDEFTRAKCMTFLGYGEEAIFSQKRVRPGTMSRDLRDRARLPSLLSLANRAAVTGLEARQALLCVSHRRQEVPPLLQQWLCLPESGEELLHRVGEPDADPRADSDAIAVSTPPRKAPARFGTFRFGPGPQDDDWLQGSWWQRMWGGEGWSPDGSYMMLDRMDAAMNWQRMTHRRGYDVRKERSEKGAEKWGAKWKGAEAAMRRQEWLQGQRERARNDRTTKANHAPRKKSGRAGKDKKPAGNSPR